MLSKNKRPYDEEELPARQRLRRNLVDIASKNELSWKRTGELCEDIHRVDPGSFADVGRTARKTTGEEGTGGKKRNGNVARNLKRKFMKAVSWMPSYWAQIRTWDVKKNKEVLEWMAFHLPHEIVAVLKRMGVVEKLLARDDIDPKTLAHLEKCEREAKTTLMALGLWGDGAPCNWDRTESIDTISISFPGLAEPFHTLRVPITAFSNKNVGPHTMDDIYEVVKWSLEVLACGVWPTSRHDGSDWRQSDCKRVKAQPLLQAALCEVRQDWKWANEVFNLPNHNTGNGICWICSCKPGEVPYIHSMAGSCDSTSFALALHVCVERWGGNEPSRSWVRKG